MNHTDSKGTAANWCVGGDLAYPLSVHMQRGVIDAQSPAELNYNKDFNTVRVAVEHDFHCLVSLFPYVDTYRKMKVLQNACRLRYSAAVIMHNWHVCCYGNQVGAYFGVLPPTLQQYFGVKP
jgi:hypothetical protein